MADVADTDFSASLSDLNKAYGTQSIDGSIVYSTIFSDAPRQ